jgi:hypothetical protein
MNTTILIIYAIACLVVGGLNADNITKWLNAKPTCKQKMAFECARRHGRV